jgi:hypothetical protein
MIWSRVLQTATKLESWHVTRGIRLTNQDDIAVLADCLMNHPSLVEVSLLDLGDVDGFWKNGTRRRNRNGNGNRNQNWYESFADTDTDNEEENDIHPERTNNIIATETPRQNDDNDETTKDDSCTPKMTLDPLVLALSTIPNLETVDITVAPEFAPKLGRLSDASFRDLFSSLPRLIDCSLWGFGLDNRHMVVLKEALQSHHRLQFLSIRRNAGITSEGWKTVSDMMEENTTLVSLYYDSVSASQSASTSATTTNTNTTADTNNEQRRLNLSAHHDRIRLFLWLNQLGRGGLLDSLTTTANMPDDNAAHRPSRLTYLNSTVRPCVDWLAFLDRVSGDPDAIFYLLQAHPRLCCRAGRTCTMAATRPTTTTTTAPQE